MSSFFPWMGGKSNMAKRLCQLLPDHKCYVEVFSGAANLLFAKQRSKTEVINDVNSELTNLFRVVRYHWREFLREIRLLLHSREIFSDFKAQPGLTDIQKAARTWFILKTAFGGRGGDPGCTFGYGTTGRARFSRLAFSAVTRCHKRLDGVFVENLDFEDCIRRYDRKHTAFYCDPPYLETHGYKTPFDIEDHKRLAKTLKKIKGKFMLSINDHPDIRKLYKGLPLLKVKVKYSVARVKTPAARDRSELIIANHPLPKVW
ncbi:MAG: DNA adenine methylase [Planctomycetes bacterium]|nr:DNA adenine methylase [Planctomycetota bacterium]